MSSDLIGRRRASEQRLDRARSLELTLKEKIDTLAEATGMTIEQLDFDGSFRAALTALAAVAARRTHFDVIVTLPDAPFAMRIQHVNDAVSAEVLIQRDGPFEPLTAPTYTEPVYVATTLPEPTVPAPSRAEPVYTATTLPAPAYQPPAYSEPVYQPPAYSEPVYQPSEYPEPVFQAPEYATPTFAAAAFAAPAYAASSASYSESPYSETSYPDPTRPTSAEESSNSPEPQSVSTDEPAAMVQVASDLAALLWQGVNDMPS